MFNDTKSCSIGRLFCQMNVIQLRCTIAHTQKYRFISLTQSQISTTVPYKPNTFASVIL